MNTKTKYSSIFTLMTFSVLLTGGLFPFTEAQAGGGPAQFTVHPSGEIATEFQGHCYAFIPPNITWNGAYLDAQTKSVNGNPGHLVTITSAAEETHVNSVSLQQGWIGYTSDIAIPRGTLDVNNYGWVTGEPAGYTNWNPGEPNNVNEFYVETHQGAGNWNDAFDTSTPILGYFVEFESCKFVGGEFLPIDNTALMLAGLQSSAIWMIPTLAGIAGTGFYLLKFRTSKE